MKLIPSGNPHVIKSILKKIKLLMVPKVNFLRKFCSIQEIINKIKGEFLCKKNEIMSEIFIIIEGFCVVLPSLLNSKGLILSSGDYFGDLNPNLENPLIYKVKLN